MTIQEYLERENRLPELDGIEIGGVPVWRIVRTFFRWSILDSYPFSVRKNIQLKTQLKNNHRSFCALLRLMLSRRKVGTLFFPHSRLYLVNDLYVERMSDPLIDYSALGEDYLVLERHQNGLHREPRLHAEHVVYLDFIDNLARVLKPLERFTRRCRYQDAVDRMTALLEKEFTFDKAHVGKVFIDILTFFFLQKSLIAPLLRHLSPKQVFVAPRQTYQFVIACCKERGIRTLELQHGVTVGETELYSGSYNPRIDPDYFCVFGQANVGPQFGIPLDRVVNIGLAYKNYVKSLGLPAYGPGVVLVISEPEISARLVDLLISFVEYYPGIDFHIRCHPQEKLSEELLSRIGKYDRITVVDNKIESFCALSCYECVLGENSTVMYEAMSMGKKVGRLDYGGFHVKETALIHGGTKIHSHDELIRFVEGEYSSEKDASDVYSGFNSDALNQLIR